MNERIQELSKEAWRQVDVSKIKGRHRAYTKIFAELIIQECATIVEGFEITQEVALDEYVDYEAGSVLKQHFGVE